MDAAAHSMHKRICAAVAIAAQPSERLMVRCAAVTEYGVTQSELNASVSATDNALKASSGSSVGCGPSPEETLVGSVAAQPHRSERVGRVA